MYVYVTYELKQIDKGNTDYITWTLDKIKRIDCISDH